MEKRHQNILLLFIAVLISNITSVNELAQWMGSPYDGIIFIGRSLSFFNGNYGLGYEFAFIILLGLWMLSGIFIPMMFIESDIEEEKGKLFQNFFLFFSIVAILEPFILEIIVSNSEFSWLIYSVLLIIIICIIVLFVMLIIKLYSTNSIKKRN